MTRSTSKKLQTINTPAGPRRYSKRALAFINLRAKGTPTRVAAEASGLSYNHAKRVQAWPETKAYMLALGAETLLFGVPRAAARVMEVVENQTSTKSALEASALVLGIAGFRPTATPTAPSQINMNVGIGIDWSPEQHRAHARLRATGIEGQTIRTAEQADAYAEAAALGATGMGGYVIHLEEGRRDRSAKPSPVIDGTCNE